jgi:ADP-ribose pyrophosphatase
MNENIDSSKVVLGSGRFVRLVRHENWEYVERLGCTGIAVIVAVTDENKLLLTEQLRQPVGRRVIELPAGLAGDVTGHGGEPLALAAGRELIEEVGYKAEQMEYLADAPSSPGLSSQVVTFFRASGLKKVGPGGGDELEDIVVHKVNMDSINEWLAEQRVRHDAYIDPELFAGLYFAGYRFAV